MNQSDSSGTTYEQFVRPLGRPLMLLGLGLCLFTLPFSLEDPVFFVLGIGCVISGVGRCLDPFTTFERHSVLRMLLVGEGTYETATRPRLNFVTGLFFVVLGVYVAVVLG